MLLVIIQVHISSTPAQEVGITEDLIPVPRKMNALVVPNQDGPNSVELMPVNLSPLVEDTPRPPENARGQAQKQQGIGNLKDRSQSPQRISDEK